MAQFLATNLTSPLSNLLQIWAYDKKIVVQDPITTLKQRLILLPNRFITPGLLTRVHSTILPSMQIPDTNTLVGATSVAATVNKGRKRDAFVSHCN